MKIAFIGYGHMASALGFADVAVPSTPATAALEMLGDAGGDAAFAGKVVVDINNPIDVETFLTTMRGTRSLTEDIAEALPGAGVGKAFNMAQARVWADEDMTWDGRRLVTPFTADSERSAEVIAELVADTGSEPLHVGGNEHAYKLEAAAALVIQRLFSGAPYDTVLQLVRPDARARR